MKQAILMSCVVAAMMASCSSDEELSNAGEKFNGNVTLTAEPYTFDDGDTRTTLTNTGSKIAFAWDDDEAIGIFPIAPTTNIQAKQVLKNGSGNSTTSSFDGAGWALMYGNTYAAYYPFNSEMKLESTYMDVPIDMTGQIQNGNNSLAHIGAGHDYMYAVADVPTNGNVNFDFKHATSIIMLELTMPEAETWQSVTLTNKSGNKIFTTSATMNVVTGKIASKATSSEVTLLLNNISTTESNKTFTVYLAVLPTTTGALRVTVKTFANRSYTASLTGKVLEAGKAYRFTASPVATNIPSDEGYENGYAWVDLGLPSGLKWANMNVGATSVIDYGNYYAWGETRAYGQIDHTNLRNYSYAGSYTKTYYDWNTYKWSKNDNGNSFSKYVTYTFSKITLDPEDDAATQNWGGPWRMPTHDEQTELENNCYWVWTSSYNGSGVAGYIVYAAKSSSDKGLVVYNGNTPSSDYSLSDSHIFLPAAGGIFYSSSLYAAGVNGYYWYSSLGGSYYAWNMNFSSENRDSQYYSNGRCNGLSVRAVCY